MNCPKCHQNVPDASAICLNCAHEMLRSSEGVSNDAFTTPKSPIAKEAAARLGVPVIEVDMIDFEEALYQIQLAEAKKALDEVVLNKPMTMEEAMEALRAKREAIEKIPGLHVVGRFDHFSDAERSLLLEGLASLVDNAKTVAERDRLHKVIAATFGELTVPEKSLADSREWGKTE